MFAHHALGRIALAQGNVKTALDHFRAAQELPDSLGAGLWNEVLLVPHQYFEAVCLEALGDSENARALYDHILILKKDYFSDMNLPELPAWQAAVRIRLGQNAAAQDVLAAHLRLTQASRDVVGAGYAKSTPFFISYMENPQSLRTASSDWQTAMIYWAGGDKAQAAAYAEKSLRGEAGNLYARLLTMKL